MSFSRTGVAAGSTALAAQLYQVLAALEGDANLGVPILLTALNSASSYALDVRNLGAGGAFRVRDTAGNILINATNAGTAVTAQTFTTSVSSVTAFATPAAYVVTTAAFFASTVSGATLMGFGTTADVTLKQKSGADALWIPTGTVNVATAGALAITGALSGVTTLAMAGALSGVTTLAASGLGTFNAGISIPTGFNVTGAGTAQVTGFATVSATTLTGTLSTAAQASVTSVGTLTSLAVTGGITSASGTTAVQALTATTGMFTGDVTLSTAGASIEIGSVSVSGTPHLDFHSSGNNFDYDARIYANGGVGVLGNGALNYTAASGHNFIGSIVAGDISGTALVTTTSVSSVTALATPAAYVATTGTFFASTVSGATLMGFGTTGDVTLKNRAGTNVVVVTSNTLNVTMAGALAMTGALSGVTTLAASGLITSTATTGAIASATATATPSAYSATQLIAFASTVSGATLMGYGTTGDVTLKNRAGTTVLGIDSNTTGVTMAGALAIGGALTATTGTFSGELFTTNGAITAATTGTIARFGLTNSGTSAGTSRNYAFTTNQSASGVFQIWQSTAEGGDPVAAGISLLLLSSTGLTVGGELVSGSTGTTLRMQTAVDFILANVANTAANFRVTDTGVATIRGGLNVSAGTTTVQALTATSGTFSGNLVSNAGSVQSVGNTSPRFQLNDGTYTGQFDYAGGLLRLVQNGSADLTIHPTTHMVTLAGALAIGGALSGVTTLATSGLYTANAGITVTAGTTAVQALTTVGQTTLGAPATLKGYTVAGLPAGVEGDVAYCTDLLTPSFLVQAVGGGAVRGPVFKNATVWVSF